MRKSLTLTCELKFEDAEKQKWFEEFMQDSPELAKELTKKFTDFEQLLSFLDFLFESYEQEKTYNVAVNLLTVFKANRTVGLREAMRAVLRADQQEDTCEACLDGLLEMYNVALVDLERYPTTRHPELPNDEAAFVIAYMSYQQHSEDDSFDEEEDETKSDPTMLN